MLISASRKTDIPAFYGEWFMNRLDAGFCEMRHSMTRRLRRVSLEREHVDAFIFWTKNPRPFVERLRETHRRGFPFYMHVTVTGYGRPIERSVVKTETALAACRGIADEFGPRAISWRYDPVVVTEQMTADWHLDNFARLADTFAGISDECATSIMVPYRKALTQFARLQREDGVLWRDPALDEKQTLLLRLSEIAAERGISLRVCSEPDVASLSEVRPAAPLPEAACIDPVRLKDIGVTSLAKPSPTREGCNCVASIDIGEYDTCPFGCAYCYATRSQQSALASLKRHEPMFSCLGA